MLLLLISISLLLITFSSFILGFQVLTLNRVVANTPLAIVETSIVQDINNDEENHLISKDKFEERINEYYTFELKNFSNKYTLDFYYFNNDDMSMCINDLCSSVWLKVTADLLYDYHYERNLIFRVMYHFYEA